MPRIRYGSLLIMAMLGASGRLLAAEIALPGNKAELPTLVDAERIFGRNDQEMVAEGSVVLRITDDGTGDRSTAGGGQGLLNIRKRMERWNGSVRMDRVEPLGTAVVIALPLDEHHPNA